MILGVHPPRFEERETVTAKEKFTKGQRVRLTAAGRAAFPKSQIVLGTVTGFGRNIPGLEAPTNSTVRVHPDGRSEASTYHMDFWEPAE